MIYLVDLNANLMSDTKQNHFVPQFYLKSFFNDSSNCIYLYDKKNDKIRESSDSKELAKKCNLYTIAQKITKSDVVLFQILADYEKWHTCADDKILSFLVAFMNDDLSYFFSYTYKGNSSVKKELIEKELNGLIHKTLCNPDVARNQEDLCTMHENAFSKVRKAVLRTKSLECLGPTPNESESPKCFIYPRLLHKIFGYAYRKMQKAMPVANKHDLNNMDIPIGDACPSQTNTI